MSQQNHHIYAFGPFRFDPRERLLLRHNQPVPLTPKVADTLQVLLENAGRLVDKDELMRRVWPDTVVEEGNLNKNIFVLRKALGKSESGSDYIETVSKRGYRFLPLVSISTPNELGVQAPEAGNLPSATPALVQPVAKSASRRRWLAFAIIALPLVFAAAYASVPRRPALPEFSLSGFRMTPLTHSGAVTSVAISPDGNYVAYVRWTSGGQQSLWLRQIAAQSDLQIAPSDSGLYGPVFSPDGNFVYFLRYSDLYSVPAIGGSPKKIFSDVASPVSFSPDGRHFVFERHIMGHDDIEVRIAATEGGDDHLLARLHEASSMLVQRGPAWSPDGRTLAIPILAIGPHTRWALDLVSVSAGNVSDRNVPDGNVRELFSGMRPLGHPVWLRDDLLLIPAYEAESGRGQLWSVSLPDGKPQRLTNDLTSYGSLLDDYGFPLDRSRDGLSLVALSTTQTGSVWAASRNDPAKPVRLTDNEPPLNNVVEAADGKLWASSADGRLWSMDHDGNHAAPYDKFGLIIAAEPCGHFLVLQQGVTLARLDADGGHPINLAQGSVFSPTCSPDGKFVFYGTADQPQKIWRVSIEGGVPVEVAPILGNQIASRLRISPDGKFICYAFQRPDSAEGAGVAIVSVAGGLPRQTISLGTEWELSWSPDGKAVQILDTTNGVSNIWEQPLSGGALRQVTRFRSGRIFDFRWSPDWQRLLMTRGEISSDAILLTARR